MLDTDWQVISTAHPGVAHQSLMDPAPAFRVRRIDSTVLVDLGGIRLAPGAGIARLGVLPDWAVAAIPQRYHWLNDSPTSLHASQVAVHLGRVIYWTGQLYRGEFTDGKDATGKVIVTRPASLHGGFEHTTVAPFPEHLIKETS